MKFKEKFVKIGLISAMFTAVGLFNTNFCFEAGAVSDSDSDCCFEAGAVNDSDADCCFEAAAVNDSGSEVETKKRRSDDFGTPDYVERKLKERRELFDEYRKRNSGKNRSKSGKQMPELYVEPAFSRLKNSKKVDLGMYIYFSPSLFYHKYIEGVEGVCEDYSKYGFDCLGFELIDEETGKKYRVLPIWHNGQTSGFRNYSIIHMSVDMALFYVVFDGADGIFVDDGFEIVPDKEYTLKVYKYDSKYFAKGCKGICANHVATYKGVVVDSEKVEKTGERGQSDIFNTPDIFNKFAHPDEFDEEYEKASLDRIFPVED